MAITVINHINDINHLQTNNTRYTRYEEEANKFTCEFWARVFGRDSHIFWINEQTEKTKSKIQNVEI